jgi:hypothetical protein
MHSLKGDQTEVSRQEGQTIVEFALVVTVLFLLLFGIIEFSRLFFAYATMSQGVREGARYGIVHNYYAEPEIIDLVTSRIVLIGGTVDVDVNYPDVDPEKGVDHYCPHQCRIVVTATSNYDPWTPLVPKFEIVAQATMHFE